MGLNFLLKYEGFRSRTEKCRGFPTMVCKLDYGCLTSRGQAHLDLKYISFLVNVLLMVFAWNSESKCLQTFTGSDKQWSHVSRDVPLAHSVPFWTVQRTAGVRSRLDTCNSNLHIFFSEVYQHIFSHFALLVYFFGFKSISTCLHDYFGTLFPYYL